MGRVCDVMEILQSHLLWQPQRHDCLPETSGTLWIHRGALTNQRCSLATGCGIKSKSNWIPSGPWFNIKMSSYQYRKSHCGDKMVIRSSYLHNGISYTGKMTSLYWIRALLVPSSTPVVVVAVGLVEQSMPKSRRNFTKEQTLQRRKRRRGKLWQFLPYLFLVFFSAIHF